MKAYCLLLASAAVIVPVVAQAADLPVKAKPVEYMRVCDAYGAGFWWVPGTQTCVKIGLYLRQQFEWQANGAQIYRNGANGRFTRVEGPGLEHRSRGVISIDTRTQTDYGVLRAYTVMGAQQTTPNAPDEQLEWDRAFIQFGGLTVGRASSFYDHWSFSRYNYVNNLTQPNIGASGILVLGYTYRFGGGWSATLAVEDGGANAAGANPVGTARGRLVVDLNQGGNLALGGMTIDNGAYGLPDIVANVRYDQAWGSVQLSGALHQNKGGYYSGPAGCGAGFTANTETCGYPDDEMGYAVSLGVVLNNVFGMQGDSISLYGSMAHGAVAYTTRGTGAWRMWGSGRSVGLGWAMDSVFVSGGQLELIDSWQVQGAYEHRWNSQWKTSIWGGYVNIDYGSGATALVCSNPLVTAPGTTLVGRQVLGATAGLIVSNCDPDFSFWNVGTRTQWNPHPMLDIGIDLQYFRVNSAFRGQAAVPADGARVGTTSNSTVVNVEDQDHLGAFFRIQYNMLP
jgi:hypothetical protein